MNHNLVVSKSIEIKAGPSKIWNVLTKPEIIKEYLFGTETVTDWKVGSPIIFQGEYKNQKYRDKGVIMENILNKTISYTYWSGFTGLEDKPENYSLVTYKLRVINESTTELSWIQKGFANEDAYKHSESGMQAFLESIKAIAER